MEETVTFKPVFWRLMIWKYVPILAGWMIAEALNRLVKHYAYASLPIIIAAFGLLTGVTIAAVILRKQYDIVITENKISGASTGIPFERVSFSISELDKSRIRKQSFYEKISGFHTLQSKSGQKIMFTHFIYGQSAVNEIYRTLEQRQ